MSKDKILVVDDDAIELEVLRHVLEAAGFEVATLSSVFDLPVTIRRDRPSVILLDVKMPGLGGDRAAATLKRHGYSRDIPVILHSGIAEAELAQIAAAAGVGDYVRKTGDFEELVQTIRRVLGSRPGSSGSD